MKKIKKLLLTLFGVLLGTVLTVQGQTAKISFRSYTIDYGEIGKGSDGLREFQFTNTGDAPLLISKVTFTCACTVSRKPEGPILPGATGEIRIKYDTNKLGPFRKAITVISNADVPIVVLKIKGEVKN